MIIFGRVSSAWKNASAAVYGGVVVDENRKFIDDRSTEWIGFIVATLFVKHLKKRSVEPAKRLIHLNVLSPSQQWYSCHCDVAYLLHGHSKSTPSAGHIMKFSCLLPSMTFWFPKLEVSTTTPCKGHEFLTALKRWHGVSPGAFKQFNNIPMWIYLTSPTQDAKNRSVLSPGEKRINIFRFRGSQLLKHHLSRLHHIIGGVGIHPTYRNEKNPPKPTNRNQPSRWILRIIAAFCSIQDQPQPDCEPTAGSVRKQQCEWNKNNQQKQINKMKGLFWCLQP